MSSLPYRRVAIVYDRINKWGGAERVLIALHDLFPDAPLYTALYNPQKASWADVFDIRTSFLQKLPFASTRHELLPFLMPLAFESFSFDEYDLVISVTSEAAKGIITKPQTKHICYCLTPTRYLWSGYDEYFSHTLLRKISKLGISYLRKWDKIAAKRPDAFIAISKEVQVRIKKYYERQSGVVYPSGANLEFEAQNSKLKNNFNNDYFLVVSRLVRYKRVDLAIQACNDMELPLRIIGTGSDELRLRNMAGPTISFLGTVTDEDLVFYYSSCRALIFPGHEDFGLSMVEVQSFGKPVIAFRGGGALEIIEEEKTGLFFSPQDKDALKKAMRSFELKNFYPTNCRRQAEKFSLEKFKKHFLRMLAEMI